MQKLEYNGYTNYETWNCALWLNNDQGTQEMMSEEAERLCKDMVFPTNEAEIDKAYDEMASFIENRVEEMQENMGFYIEASMFADLLNAALREIDYHDIAKSQMADALWERQEEWREEKAQEAIDNGQFGVGA